MTAASAAAITAAIREFREEVGLLDTGLLFLALTLLATSLWGRRVGLLAAAANYFCLNFFFIEPLHRLVIHDPKNLGAWFLEIAVFVGVAIVGGRTPRRTT